MTVQEWRTYCREVVAAADQLRGIGECAAIAATAYGPSSVQTYATMMLGPLAALETLRRRLRA